MSTRDGARGLRATSLLAPADAVGVGTVNSAGMDTKEGETATILVHNGAVVNAGQTAKLQEGDTLGGAYSDVDADEVIGDTVDDTVDTVFKLGYTGTRRFVRVQIDVTGDSDLGVVGLLGRLDRQAEPDK